MIERISSKKRFWLFKLALIFVCVIVISISTAIVKHVSKQHNLQKSIFIKKINELSLKIPNLMLNIKMLEMNMNDF